MSPEPGAKANGHWCPVGWMLVHCRDGLLSSNFCLIFDSSVGWWVAIHAVCCRTGFTDTWVRIPVSPEEGNLSAFDSEIARLCQGIKININSHVCIHVYFYAYVNRYWYLLSNGIVFLLVNSKFEIRARWKRIHLLWFRGDYCGMWVFRQFVTLIQINLLSWSTVMAILLTVLTVDGDNRSCAVPGKKRRDCGYSGISRQRCLDNGCCFDNSVPVVLMHWRCNGRIASIPHWLLV